jgi:hypothetical protein
MIFGLLSLATGLYDKVGPEERAEAEEAYRNTPTPEPDRR